MTFFTREWSALGKSYLRKNEIESMLWYDYLNLNNCSIAFSKLSGPIAVIQRNSTKLQINKVNYQEKFLIEIFNSFGKKISEIPWSSKNDSILCYFNWSSNQELYCLTKKGDIYVYDIKGILKTTFNLYIQIKDCKFFEQDNKFGFVILTELNKFQSYSNFNNFKPFKYPDLPKTYTDLSSFIWSIGKFNTQGCPDLIFSLDNEIYLLCFNRPFYQSLRYTFDLKSTKNGILMFTYLNDLNLIPNTEINNHSSNMPNDLIWFCNQAICVVWDDIILIVNSSKEFTTYSFDEKEPLFIIDEFDGLRIISNKTHEFIEILPQDTIEIFRIGSDRPGAYLVEAYKEFNKKSHLSNDYIKILQTDFILPQAIQQTINAAKSEFKITTQKLLLRSASFGKCFLPDYDPTEFIDTCLTLRVLNIIREQNVGLPLSLKQYKLIGINTLIQRLIDLEMFSLAIKICDHLSVDIEIGRNKILKEWALYKVRQTEYDDEKVVQDIVKKIGNTNGISYSEIANLAVEYNRKNLSFYLLNYETKSADQVNLLLKLGNEEEAIEKAIESGDTNLIYKVILSKYYQENSHKILALKLKKYPLAYSLYEKYLKETDKFELTNFYHAEERNDDRGFCFLKESYDKNNHSTGKNHELSMALESFRLSNNEFMLQSTEEQIRLIARQKKLEDKLKQTDPSISLNGLSVYDTIEQLIRIKMYKQAEDLKRDFKLSDKMYYHLKINILAKLQDWTELNNFANIKKSPIGYEPFVDCCLNYKNKYEAQKYLAKVAENNKIEYYFRCGLIEEAGQLCRQQRNSTQLEELINRCTNSQTKNKLIQYLNEIK